MYALMQFAIAIFFLYEYELSTLTALSASTSEFDLPVYLGKYVTAGFAVVAAVGAV